ncbi:MAG TPA: prolyl oligopeptidase family serine peptidase [Vicinamibacterales bacterium]|nr:prolyl oligopeptidase family serine peptidase [Vicinamibacterales bacterium]
MRSRAGTMFVAAVVAMAQVGVLTQKIQYPATKTVDVVDDYHGTKVADPYRWLEDLESPDTAEWVAAQNRLTDSYLAAQPIRAHFRRRIERLWNFPKTNIPVMEGGRLFYRRNTGLQLQSPLYMRDSPTAPPTQIIDPNLIWPDATASLATFAPSPDTRHLAYAFAKGGADWQTIAVRSLTTGQDLADEVRWMRFSGLSWTKDSKGFFYSRYPEPPAGRVMEAALSGHALYYHVIGTPQSQDRLIFTNRSNPSWFVTGALTEDGRYLLIATAKGSDNNNRLYSMDLGDPKKPNIAAPVRAVFEADDAEFSPIGSRGSVLFLRTDRGAPNRKIIAVDVKRSDPASWRTVVPESSHAIENATAAGGRIFVEYLVDVKSRLAMFDLSGKPAGDVRLPGAGSLSGFFGREDSSLFFYAFTSPLYPTTVFLFDIASGTSTPFEAANPPVDISQYETTQLFATSKDGTRVPFFLTARKGLAKDGSNPTMLYAYGGFSVSVMPGYRPDVPAWLDLGGIWITANLRGGAEYGEAWHKAGILEKKQNVFDDFIAVAEFLVRERYTSPAKLGIMGGSNGGLLVAAVMEQRPDLFAAVLPAAGVLDALRYDRFTGGRAWVTEYGTARDPGQFATLFKYSPLHNLKPGTCYPATLVTTADHDDRVVPSHSFKFTAALQAAQGCDQPVLIRVETGGSHNFRSTDRRIAELADEWTFTAAQMGIRQKR